MLEKNLRVKTQRSQEREADLIHDVLLLFSVATLERPELRAEALQRDAAEPNTVFASLQHQQLLLAPHFFLVLTSNAKVKADAIFLL
jgi:hypothetical protein